MFKRLLVILFSLFLAGFLFAGENEDKVRQFFSNGGCITIAKEGMEQIINKGNIDEIRIKDGSITLWYHSTANVGAATKTIKFSELLLDENNNLIVK